MSSVNEHPPADPLYEAQVASRLQQILKAGPSSLQFIVSRAEGAYPTDVIGALRKLEGLGAVKESQKNVWMSTESGHALSGTCVEVDQAPVGSDDSDFPEAHPLDFDWRFARRTLEWLNERMGNFESGGIGVLGAPTLFKYLVDHGKTAHLFDKNEQIVRYLMQMGYTAITQCDLFRFSSNSEFACVVADPPWYLDHYRAFIEAARGLLVANGKLLLSVLPRLTRPSAALDRSEIVAFASSRGFDLARVETGSLEYLSPPFEVEALKTEGLNVSTWRSGDLYTFVLREGDVPEIPSEYVGEEYWHTFNIGPTVVKVKWDGTHGHGALDIQNVSRASDMRLGSVSRRSPLRSQVNLWTSRNVVLHVSRPDLVCAALQLLGEGYDGDNVAKALVNAEQLNTLDAKRLEELVTILITESRS
jgi:hypothetical protein